MKSYFNKFKMIDTRLRGLARGMGVPAVVAGLVLLAAQPAGAALGFLRGTVTAVGVEQFSSVPDSAILTGAFTGPGVINNGLFMPENRIQYDIINADQGPLYSWTIHYSAVVGPFILGACTPLGYITPTGATVPQGGNAYTTLFNAGYGVYNYNTGAAWIIDYEPDHITFSSAIAGAFALPPDGGVGYLSPTPYLPSFSIEYDPALSYGMIPASAVVGSVNYNGLVYGPIGPSATNCITLTSTNIVVYTCNPCTNVNYNVKVTDNCCSNVTLQYFPPQPHCFPLNSTNVVQVLATDVCGNGATNFFTVVVLPAANCNPTNTPCISIQCTNLVAYTCSNSCVPVTYNATATDRCCPASGATLTYNPPSGFCFPPGTTVVKVTANDQCGSFATNSFTVTVLPGNCSSNGCIALQTTNIVVYACSNSAVVNYTAQFTDRCCNNAVLSFSPPSGSVFPLGTTPVQATVTDRCNNSLSKVFTVTVIQTTTGPVINCPASITLPCVGGTGFGVMPDETTNPALIAGNVGPVTVTQSIPPGTGLSGMTLVTLTVMNVCGQTASCTVPVYVVCDPALTMGTNAPGTPKLITFTWPPGPAQLQYSVDMSNWPFAAFGTNQPYTFTNPPPNAFFRLQYRFPTNVIYIK
jgi:large repetitive protein